MQKITKVGEIYIMKRFMKIIALLLTFILSISSFPVVFGEEEPAPVTPVVTAVPTATPTPTATPKPVNKYLNATKTLSGLKLFDDINLDGFDSTATVSKTRFCKMVVQLMGSEIISGTSPFADVTKDTPDADYILTAYSMGLVAPNKDGNFGIADDMIVSDAVKMLVTVLGYSPFVKTKSGTMSEYINTAISIGIMKGTNSLDLNDSLKAGEATALIYNSLNVDIMSMSVAGDKSEFKVEKGKNILTEKLKLQKKTGLIYANSFTNVLGGSKTGNIKDVLINGVLYEAGYTNISDYVGYNIEFYSNKDDSSDIKTIKYFELKDNTIVNIKQEDRNSYTKNSITYNVEGSTKTQKVIFNDNIDIVVNGVLYLGLLDDALILDGNLIFVDNNNDGNYEILFVENTEDYFVSAVNVADLTVVDKYGKKFTLENKDDCVVVFGSDRVGFDEIDKDDILTVYRTANGVNRIVISREIVSGTVTQKIDDIVTYQAETVDDKITIDEKEYKVSKNFKLAEHNKKVTVTKLGLTGKFFLNIYGEIAGKLTTSTDFQYGYLFKGAIGNGVDSKLSLKILTATDGWATYDTKSKLIVDGVTYNNMLSTSNVNVLDTLKSTIEEPYKAATTAANANGAKSYCLQQLIRFRTNQDGEIIEIDTRNKGVDETTDSLNRTYITANIINANDPTKTQPVKSRFNINTNCFLDTSDVTAFTESISTSKNTYFFQTPSVGDVVNGKLEDELYYKMTVMPVVVDQIFTIAAYRDDNDELTANKAIVFYGMDASLDVEGDSAVVKKVVSGIDSSGQTRDKLYVVYQGGEQGYFLADNCKIYCSDSMPSKGLIFGSVIRYALNSSKEIMSIQVDYAPKNNEWGTDINSTNAYGGGNPSMDYKRVQTGAVAIGFSDTMLKIQLAQNKDSNFALRPNVYHYLNPNCAIYLVNYDRTNPERQIIRVGTTDDIKENLFSLNPTSYLYVRQRYFSSKAIVVYLNARP